MKKLRIETDFAETLKDADDLQYYLGRIVQKNWLIRNNRGAPEAGRSNIFKRNIAAYDSEKILAKYGYNLGMLVTSSSIERPDGTTGNDTLAYIEGLVEPSSISTDRLALRTPRGTFRVSFAHMPETDDPSYIPSVQPHGQLELPSSFITTADERLQHEGLEESILIGLHA